MLAEAQRLGQLAEQEARRQQIQQQAQEVQCQAQQALQMRQQAEQVGATQDQFKCFLPFFLNSRLSPDLVFEIYFKGSKTERELKVANCHGIK